MPGTPGHHVDDAAVAIFIWLDARRAMNWNLYGVKALDKHGSAFHVGLIHLRAFISLAPTTVFLRDAA